MLIALGLGSNVGDRISFLRRAIALLGERGGRMVAVSSLYESEALGPEQDYYLNAACVLETELWMGDIFRLAKQIEQDLGRQNRGRWMPREIDIDLLLEEAMVYSDQSVQIPHIGLAERAFVLDPLAEIAPTWVHPVLGLTMVQLRNQLVRKPGDCVLYAPPSSLSSGWDTHRIHRKERCVSRATLEYPVIPEAELDSDAVSAFIQKFGAIFVPIPLQDRVLKGFQVGMRDAFRRADRKFRVIGDTGRKVHSRSGYTPPSVERVTGHAPDPNRHFWDILRHDTSDLDGSANLWATVLFSRLEQLSGKILHNLDQNFGTTMAADATDGTHLIRASQYLNQVADGSELFPPHVDWGLATWFIGGSAAGLCQGDGRSLQIPEGVALFAPGTLMGAYTRLLIRPFRHSVRAMSVDRLSVVFFLETRDDVLLPTGELAADRSARLLKQVRA